MNYNYCMASEAWTTFDTLVLRCFFVILELCLINHLLILFYGKELPRFSNVVFCVSHMQVIYGMNLVLKWGDMENKEQIFISVF